MQSIILIEVFKFKKREVYAMNNIKESFINGKHDFNSNILGSCMHLSQFVLMNFVPIILQWDQTTNTVSFF